MTTIPSTELAYIESALGRYYTEGDITATVIQRNWDRCSIAESYFQQADATLAICFATLIALKSDLRDAQYGTVSESDYQEIRTLENLYAKYQPAYDTLRTRKRTQIARSVRRIKIDPARTSPYDEGRGRKVLPNIPEYGEGDWE